MLNNSNTTKKSTIDSNNILNKKVIGIEITIKKNYNIQIL